MQSGKRSLLPPRGIGALLVAAVLVTACSGGAGDEQAVLPALRARHDAASQAYPYRNLSELLGNRAYRAGNRPAVPLTSAVVVGRFTQVSPGRAFTVEGADAPDGTLADFDDAKAVWRTVHATFEVQEVISGTAPGARITVGLAFGPEVSVPTVEKDLIALGRTAVFLNRSAVFAYDRSVYGTVLDGALLAPVSDTGQLSLPALSPGEAAQLLKGSASVAALQEKARGPRQVIQLDETGTERLTG